MKKGIFCIEGFWHQGNVKETLSVHPILDLLNKSDKKVPFLHHRCATREEVFYMLDRWCTKRIQNEYPILYFATHGEAAMLDFGGKVKISLDELEKHLYEKAGGCIFFFGSCFTMKKDKRLLQKFVNNTGALAAMGYTIQVDWLESAAAELLAHYYIQEAKKLDNTGVKEMQKAMAAHTKFLKTQGFRLIPTQRIIRRKRNL